MINLVLVNTTEDMECPPLTLVYLATYLKKHLGDGIKIRIIDINFEDPLKKIIESKPDIICISSMTIKYNYTKRLGKKIKQKLKSPVIIGGVHISTCPESFDKSSFDIGVIGEGEKTLLELIKVFEIEKSFPDYELKKIDGLIFSENNNLVRTKPRELLANLDELPIPDRSILNKGYFKPKISYNKLRGEKVIEAGMLTSRGCPYRCIFCSTSKFWDRLRFHSPERVAQEIDYLVGKFKVNYLLIYDDLFAVSEKRAKDIYNELKKRGLIGKIKISCSLRANVVTDNLCRILKKMGAVTINFGFESGSNNVLQYLKAESVTVEQNKKAVLLCRKYGFDVTGSFMLGSPTETLEDMHKTLELMDWMKEHGAVELWCGVTKPYPSTQLWEYGINHKLINKNFNWDLVDPRYIHNPVFLDKSISKKEFFKLFKEAKYKSFAMSMKGQENKLIRNAKDLVYYNKILHDIFIYFQRIIPKKIKKLFLSYS